MEHTYKVTARDGNTYITEGVVALTFADEYWTFYSKAESNDDGHDILVSYHLPTTVIRMTA